MLGGQLRCARHHFEGIDLSRRRAGRRWAPPDHVSFQRVAVIRPKLDRMGQSRMTHSRQSYGSHASHHGRRVIAMLEADIARRAESLSPSTVLEIAAGTGVV